MNRCSWSNGILLTGENVIIQSNNVDIEDGDKTVSKFTVAK